MFTLMSLNETLNNLSTFSNKTVKLPIIQMIIYIHTKVSQ
ncbi:hypothetical protein SPONL_376 [uncultured Candidatus Thioglobus sp.]|nr:hypothetical protein SPONL_376 [uncultured Candidatus Thioglobus sp.]